MNKKRKLFKRQTKKSFLGRWLKIILSTLFLILITVLATGYGLLYSSLPDYEGTLQAERLDAKVTIERDTNGVPHIQASNRTDLAFALGFTHAQERFFQMDLLRRRPAGELSELFGGVALSVDKGVRIHRFRARSYMVYQQLTNEQQALLTAYRRGVNKGLQSLSAKPFEYWLLNTEPTPWRDEDSLLVVYAMYLSLQSSSGEREAVLQSAYQTMDNALYRFLVPSASSFDAPIDGSALDLPPIPTTVFDRPVYQSPTSVADKKPADTTNEMVASSLMNERLHASQPIDPFFENPLPGSNNFAVAGSRSKNGAAIVAGDMHLGHAVPNIWYQAQLTYQHHKQNVSLAGATLPGTPLLVAGTNGKIAWAFTNSYGDYSDAIKLSINPDDANQYQVDGEWRNFVTHREEIKIKNAPSEELIVKESIYGPIEPTLFANETKDKPLTAWSFRWIAHAPEAINLHMIELETAASVEQAIDIANRSAIPAQNFLVGDQQGRIGWTIIGRLPKMNNAQHPLPNLVSENGNFVWLSAEDYPKNFADAHHAIWTANNRIVGNEALDKIGDGGYANGIRGRQIRDSLLSLEQATEMDLLDIQLDTEAQLHWRWQRHLLDVIQIVKSRSSSNASLSGKLSTIDLDEAEQFLKQWNRKADIDQVGYTLVKRYRTELKKRLLDPWVAQLKESADGSISYYSKQYEFPLWTLVNQKPETFLPEPFASYNDLFADALTDTINTLTENGPLMDQTWGSQNTLRVQHPISRAIPFLSAFLDLPSHPMPGDMNIPRVQTPSFGASQRMVISPGHLENAIFHMPGGQSAHPLSEFYHKGYEDWLEGNPRPLLAGEPVYRLLLSPD